MKKILYLDYLVFISVSVEVIFRDYLDLDGLKLELLVVSLYVFLKGWKRFGDLLHPYVLFLLCYNMFLNSRVFIDLVNGKPFYYTTYFSNYPFSYGTQVNMLLMLNLSLVCINLGQEIALHFSGLKKLELSRNNTWLFFSKFVMCVFLLPVLLYFFQVAREFLLNGYGGISSITKHSILSHAVTFFQIGFYAFLASKPSLKQLKIYGSIFVITLFLSIFSGARNMFATQILMLLSYFSLYVKKISQIVVVFFITIGAIFFELFGGVRDDPQNVNMMEYFVSTEESIAEIFFRHQGVTITVLGYADELAEQSSVMDVVYPIYEYFGEKMIDDYEPKDVNFGHKVSFLINPSFYYSGHGTGTSFLAELYSAGGFVSVMVGSFLLSFFVIYSIYTYGSSTMGCLLLLIFFKYLYFMPRAGYLAFLSDVLKWYVIICILKKIYNLFHKRKEYE